VDVEIRSLQRAAQSNPHDISELWAYIRALERLQEGVNEEVVHEQQYRTWALPPMGKAPPGFYQQNSVISVHPLNIPPDTIVKVIVKK
jgi:hypothetical protein